MKKIRMGESELVDLIEKLVKENIGGGTGFANMLNTPTSKYKDLYEDEDVENEEELEEDEVNADSAQDGDETLNVNVMKQTNQTDWMGENKITESQLVRRLSKKLHEAEGKGCAESEGGSGCIKKRGSGWVILNNKKGGVWRKCTSEKDCQEQLDAFHANS
tara:strand:+ start:10181 stop:10663 length:483 start_codon:yes stop_codon:yes gene_type:complete